MFQPALLVGFAFPQHQLTSMSLKRLSCPPSKLRPMALKAAAPTVIINGHCFSEIYSWKIIREVEKNNYLNLIFLFHNKLNKNVSLETLGSFPHSFLTTPQKKKIKVTSLENINRLMVLPWLGGT